MLVDEAKIHVVGGHGGPGRISFYPNRGKPCGGDGGKGGDIYAVVKPELSSLFRYMSQKEFVAGKGHGGESNDKTGRHGDDLILPFPKGTELRDVQTDEVIELNGAEPVMLVKGGTGGWGNSHISHIQPGMFAKSNPGKSGYAREFVVVMRLIADCGFIGLPNAGKSSLLNALTDARAKVADYPFTTLDPNLGVLLNPAHERIVIADIPGLIEGASEGKGLGIKFLKHVEKVQFFVHCVSAASETIVEDYRKVRAELAAFNESLVAKPEILLITKSDLITDERRAAIREEVLGMNPHVYFSSIINDAELDAVRSLIYAHVTV